MEKRIDITENIAGGNVEHIISVLKRFLEIGYDRLYWDSYDSAIYLYKSNCTKCSYEKDLSISFIISNKTAKLLQEKLEKQLLKSQEIPNQ